MVEGWWVFRAGKKHQSCELLIDLCSCLALSLSITHRHTLSRSLTHTTHARTHTHIHTGLPGVTTNECLQLPLSFAQNLV